MQSEQEDRRATHVRRVELETLVEICGRDKNVPPFEAESVEISGRGMQVRTRFLPEVGAPLVLRFEHDGTEVLVEGEVAWRKGDDKGGQFGIRFTALDSKSVAALKALCSRAPEKKEDAPQPGDKAAPAALTERGAPVKLHIQGLGAPMKARVFRGSERRLEVGSQLEFLKVGRNLELEDVSAGARRSALIDGVSVAIDAQSQIPQLVVSLRYEGLSDDTPGPTVMGPKKRAAAAETNDDEDYESDDEAEDEEFTEDIFKGKVGAWAASAGRAMKSGSVQMASWTSNAAGGFGDLVRSVSQKVGSREARPSASRRTSRPPVQQGPVRSQSRRSEPLRPQKQKLEEPKRGRNLKSLAYAGALGICIYGTYSWLGRAAHESDHIAPSAELDRLNADAEYDTRVPAARAPRGAVGLPPGADSMGGVGQAGAMPAPPGAPQAAPPGALPQANGLPEAPLPPGRFPKGAALDTTAQLQANNRGIVAQVPLFGATEMATSEAAPVNPPPRNDVVDEYSLAKDQFFPGERAAQRAPVRNDEVPPARAQAAMDDEPQRGNAEETTGSDSFQVGRMNLPVVYRLRLDGAGTTLQGSKQGTGFTVLVPGRKVMESGAVIEGRDDRITDVRVQNTPAGGKVTFHFRKEISGYKARLRKDYVEFFINSPDKKK
ncbi:MAG TPA: PilZ domain-containing protein [Polyangiaceae bacterium]|nr:PilZ domain-containing protein [Polyangiaceae bacterium]